MKKAQVVINMDTLSLESGRVTACFYVQLEDGTVFPESNWNDFVCVVISWWISSSQNLDNGSTQEAFLFMDGPLKYVLEKQNGTFVLSFWHREVLVQEVRDIDFNYLQKSLFEEANSLLTWCHNNGFISQDISELESSLLTV